MPEQPQWGVTSGRAPVAPRRAAIGFADIVGYSILMAAEERRTHDRWMALLGAIIRPTTTIHCGRIVDVRGDGVLAEFATAADGLRWALDVQRAMAARNAGVAAWAVPYGYNAGRPIADAHPDRIFQTLGDVARHVLDGR